MRRSRSATRDAIRSDKERASPRGLPVARSHRRIAASALLRSAPVKITATPGRARRTHWASAKPPMGPASWASLKRMSIVIPAAKMAFASVALAAEPDDEEAEREDREHPHLPQAEDFARRVSAEEKDDRDQRDIRQRLVPAIVGILTWKLDAPFKSEKSKG